MLGTLRVTQQLGEVMFEISLELGLGLQQLLDRLLLSPLLLLCERLYFSKILLIALLNLLDYAFEVLYALRLAHHLRLQSKILIDDVLQILAYLLLLTIFLLFVPIHLQFQNLQLFLRLQGLQLLDLQLFL